LAIVIFIIYFVSVAKFADGRMEELVLIDTGSLLRLPIA